MKRSGLVWAVLIALVVAVGCSRTEEPASKTGTEPETKPQTEAERLLGWVDRLKVGAPAGHANLVVFPVFARTPEIGEEYLTLDEGIKGKLIRITEVGHRETPEEMQMTVTEIEAKRAKAGQSAQDEPEGRVNTLLVHNHSDKPLFILAGQTLWGGKQDRLCPEDMVVAPHTSNVEVKVFCVEHGRWHVDSDEAATFELSSVAVDKVRKSALKEKDQSMVWTRVAEVRSSASSGGLFADDEDSGTDAYLEAADNPKMKATMKPTTK